ncbi:MAG: transcription-repair coupling factor [Bacteroidetes bacterium]|nr:MAG: transcription-repair coupling factor [Bacteroidota bacterium]
MELKAFRSLFGELELVEQSAQHLAQEGTRINWKKIHHSVKSICAAETACQVPGHHLFVLEDKEEAAYFLNDLQSLYPDEKRIFFYPESYRSPYQFEETDNANVVSRAEVLEKVSSGSNAWIVSYPKALFEKVPGKKVLKKNTLKIKKGESYSLDFINELLFEYGFERVDFVYEPGQFAIRGGLVDVFSYSNDLPYRMEFFGDEVDSIRSFDPSDQLSEQKHQFFTIVPNVQGVHLREDMVSLPECLGSKSCIWLSSHQMVKAVLSSDYEKAVRIYSESNSELSLSEPEKLYMSSEEWEKVIQGRKLVQWGPDFSLEASLEYELKLLPQPSFNKNFELFRDQLIENKEKGIQSLFFSAQPKQIERLYRILEDIGAEAQFISMPFALHEGFLFPDLKLACYTDHQLFERYHRFRLKEGFRQAKQALTLKEIYNLQKGDYVTHIDHGVGQFSGLQTIDVNGKPQEAIRLIYKDGDVLYVSIHSLHRISKFTGKDGAVPKMNKLGTQAWSNLKKKTKKKIKELAFDLIQVYAKRKSQPGYAFSPDNFLQTELEASFIYEDTPDQLKTTQAIKEDMESPTPMDRLICGDVGFGKTELAIRAAFKAVCDSKQVAVLVPTTILCHQHFRSFSERLKDFPAKVDYINRFKSAKQITETLKKVKSGEIDILIGTHKIVGDRVKFKDLGLMIIDEEQKFGVAVKDKLKTLKVSIDTLTLTATPIPRTLQFSLMGARDLSIINTPPANRQPVLTEIIRLQEEQIRDAIAYEVSRGGQVYFVHNRLQNIKEVAGMIQRLCPGVRIAIGHGQMEGSKLEKIMMDFIQGEYDVLLATTIIESGIDIPNANTIIINHANNFGLSDLHQLRGRVGRSNKKAFCYLIAPQTHELTSDARKRLEALVQFSDLGSGFNIAMKDLDIRGAGNLLGGEQSGFINDIGFEMYQKILQEAMEELKENEFKELYAERNTDQPGNYVRDCVIETDLELRIPEDYVNNVAERLNLYQELDHLKDEQDLERFAAELTDRFGPIPETVYALFQSFELRWKAQAIGIEKLVIKNEKMVCYFLSNPQSAYYESQQFQNLLNYIQSQPTNCRLSEKNDKLRLIYQQVVSIQHALKRLSEIQISEI